jgi:prepilin-type processing-associated H-X9-DG protein
VRQAWIAGCIPGTAGEVGGGTPLFASAADALVSWADTDEEMLRLQPGYRPLLPNGGACGTTPPARVDQSWGSTSSAPGAAADVAARIRTGAMSLPGIRSRHAGGANALMADGSARFLSNDIEAEVLVRLTILLPDRHPTARPVAQPAAGGAFAR